MTGKFEDTWADIQRRLPVRESIQNWSADKGYTRGRFRITDVEPSSVTIQADDTSVLRRIAKSEFQMIFAGWPGYQMETARRSVPRDKSKSTTYILSILHWRETSSA